MASAMASPIASLINRLQALGEQGQNQALQEVADELLALQSIYGDDSLSLLSVHRNGSGRMQAAIESKDDSNSSISQNELNTWSPDQPIRLSLRVPLDLPSGPSNAEQTHQIEGASNGEEPSMRLAAILPPDYPSTSTSLPQLQLLSRYIGSHGVDYTLFGQVLRIYRRADDTEGSSSSSSASRVDFTPGNVAIFDGIEKARELIETWYSAREAERLQREESSSRDRNTAENHQDGYAQENEDEGLVDDLAALDVKEIEQHKNHRNGLSTATPSVVKLTSSAALVERKSTFVGHAAPLHHPGDISAILSNLLQDRRIARATHPAIFAWVCKTPDGVIHRDCDDDGETAAGGRLAHLLDLLQLENAIVIVTRWYGGVLLGADRFKFINRAARDALELAGLIDGGGTGGVGAKAAGSKTPRNTR